MRHKNKIKGFILILFILPYLAFSAGESNEDTPQTANEETDNTQTEQAPKKAPLVRSFTPSQKSRVEALIAQIEKSAPNEVESLNFQDESFLALYRAASNSQAQGCIILLHGNNEHPNWPNVINPVRMNMTENSWCTLSIEIPDSSEKESLSFIKETPDTETVAESDGKLPNEETVFGRIGASIAYANEQGISNISLLGYGTGATYALKYSAENKLNTGALILISTTMPGTSPPFVMAKLLASSLQPVLDYYIQPNQLDKQYANARRTAMGQRETQNPIYTRIKVTSNSQFSIDENQLIQRIRGFLKQNTKQREQLKRLPIIRKSLFYQAP
ncbi:hypothetical protein A9Q77_03740 [Marinomonas sp. 42_23_T18]|nr:hypothetical protein A9Q77_03740 [Marinomonas sp. 42_23_T18]